MVAMVTPRIGVKSEREERHRALIHWDSLLHETLEELRDALERIKELDRKDARANPR